MNKDFLIAASVTVLLHGGLVWLGQELSHPSPALLKPVDRPVVFAMPTIPPEEDPIDLTDPEEAGKTEAAAPTAPTIADPPPMPGVFQTPIDPTPPSVPGPLATIPTIVNYGPGGDRQGVGRVFDLGQLSHVPLAVVSPSPNYPFELRRSGVQGTAYVDFIVDAHGNVLRPYATREPGADNRPEFDSAAVEALKRWHFRPGMKDGRPVATHMQIPIVFSLSRS